MLSQTRQPGFSGPGAFQLADIVILYQAQGWSDGEVELIEYIKLMLFLDSVHRQYHDERKPRGK